MRWFTVGKIVNTHGLKGEVRVISETDFPEARFQIGNELYFFAEEETMNEQPLIIRTHRQHKGFELLSFEQYDDLTDVEQFKGGHLKVSDEQRKHDELEKDEFYYDDIIGCTVFSEKGEQIGTVTEILAPGANDVWVVQQKQNDKLIYIPYIKPIVKQIDVSEKKIIIHVMEGLIE